MRVNKSYLYAVGLILVTFSALGIFGEYSQKHFFLNLTKSEPVGLYKVESLKGELKRGDLVLFYPPKDVESYVYGRRWLPAGWPLLKNVGGLPGDTYCVTGSTFSLNGKRVGEVATIDSQGLPLPRITGCFKVPDGHFLPVATHAPNSFDGRYMGATPTERIIAKVKPVVTW